MKYLIVEGGGGGDDRETNTITDEDRQQVEDGQISIFRFEEGGFQILYVGAEEGTGWIADWTPV